MITSTICVMMTGGVIDVTDRLPYTEGRRALRLGSYVFKDVKGVPLAFDSERDAVLYCRDSLGLAVTERSELTEKLCTMSYKAAVLACDCEEARLTKKPRNEIKIFNRTIRFFNGGRENDES
jgi:hypothetical protein